MRLILTLVFLVTLTGGIAAQQQRPAETRTVPLDLLCGPLASLTEPAKTIRIVAGAERGKTLFGPGDTVMLNAGTAQGISVGQRFFVRRVIEDRFAMRTTEKSPLSIHTAGWVTVVDVQGDVSTAKVAEACDGISEGDYLEPLVVPPPVAAGPDGQPDFARPARVILAGERRQLGAGGGSLMVIDRGSDHGLRPGQRLTLFRQTADAAAPTVTIGDAVVASTQAETSLIRIDKASEVIQVGDLIAIHR